MKITRPNNRLGNAWCAIGVLALLAACSSNSVVSNNNWPRDRTFVDGFDLNESNRVLSHGLTQIDARALEQPLMGHFVLMGLTGLADIDPLFSFVDDDARVRSYIGTTLASDLAKPADQDISSWLYLFHGSLIGAGRKS